MLTNWKKGQATILPKHYQSADPLALTDWCPKSGEHHIWRHVPEQPSSQYRCECGCPYTRSI